MDAIPTNKAQKALGLGLVFRVMLRLGLGLKLNVKYSLHPGFAIAYAVPWQRKTFGGG